MMKSGRGIVWRRGRNRAIMLIPLFIVELFTPEEPDAEPEPLIPSLPKSSALTLPPALFLPPVKNEPKAARG